MFFHLENYVLVVNSFRIFLARKIVYKFYACIEQTYTVPTYDIQVAPPFGFCMDWLIMPGQFRRKKMSFLRTLQKQGALWPCVAFIILCWFSARMVKSCEEDICPCSSTLEDDMYVRADELYCLLKLMWISEKPTDFLSVETLTLKSLLEETTCFQPGRWCCCVGSTHTQWPAYAPWALGYRLVYMIPCLIHRYILTRLLPCFGDAIAYHIWLNLCVFACLCRASCNLHG